MSQRSSGYARKERDCYETPEWVTAALMPHVPRNMHVWEPAAGSGKIAAALFSFGHTVETSDIHGGQDFLGAVIAPPCDAIITNPPYELAREFIERSLAFAPIIAMLLRTDYDHAAGRQHLFGKCTAFAKKLVLTKRIVWFEGPKAAPSFNHAWYLWECAHRGPPVLAYGP